MRIFSWIKKLRYLLVLVAVNMLLSFLIEPASGASGRMWSGYYDEQNLDMIFVGNSVCQQGFIPDIFNENLSVKAYNMGTPSQAVPQSMRAIEVALEEHDIKTVVFAIGFSSLKYEPISEAELTFESARTRQKGGIKGALATLSYMYSPEVVSQEESVNFLFPWLYNYEDYSKATMLKNATQKLEKWKKRLETGNYDETEGLNKGFRNDDTRVINYDEIWEDNSYCYYESYFNAEMLADFEELLSFCAEQGVDLIVLNTPHPSFDVVSCYEFYENNQEQVKEICDKYGVDYYDFSLIKSEIYEVQDENFVDYEHLNRAGAKEFCEKLCDFLKLRASGEDMSQYFYSVEEFLEIHEDLLNEWKKYESF